MVLNYYFEARIISLIYLMNKDVTLNDLFEDYAIRYCAMRLWISIFLCLSYYIFMGKSKIYGDSISIHTMLRTSFWKAKQQKKISRPFSILIFSKSCFDLFSWISILIYDYVIIFFFSFMKCYLISICVFITNND